MNKITDKSYLSTDILLEDVIEKGKIPKDVIEKGKIPISNTEKQSLNLKRRLTIMQTYNPTGSSPRNIYEAEGYANRRDYLTLQES